MDTSFPPTLIPNVRVGGRYTLFGRIEDSRGPQQILFDGSGSIKVFGCSSPLRGYVEIRGQCTSIGSIEVISCLQFADEDVDFTEYARAVNAINAFGGDYAAMVTGSKDRRE